MNTREYNEYKVIHKDGKVEDINSLTMIEALESLETPDTASDVLQISLMKEGVKTLIEDEPREVTLIVSGGSASNYVTPTPCIVHVGDTVNLRAFPAEHYRFVSWTLNNIVLSNIDSYDFIVPEPEAGSDTITVQANFELKNVRCDTEVLPAEAASAGCFAFPEVTSNIPVNTVREFLAEAKGNFVFDHWEINSAVLSTNTHLIWVVPELEANEDKHILKAIFRAAE